VFLKNLGLSFGGLYIFVILLFIKGRYKIFAKEFDSRFLLITLSFIPYLIAGVFMIYFTETRVYAELIAPVTILFIIYLSTIKSLNLFEGKTDWQTTGKIL
jgi:membrane-bound ClpP family serine protease